MRRPKRDVQELMADQFADMSLATQDQMLLVLTSIHRQARRMRLQPEHEETNGEPDAVDN